MRMGARVFRSFAEADLADQQAYRDMTPDRRVELALFIFDSYYGSHEGPQRMERVAKLIKRPRRKQFADPIEPEK